jgi:hypothetical protein
MEHREVSRRSLLKGGGAALAGLSLQVSSPAHAFPQNSDREKPERDDDQPDPSQSLGQSGDVVIPWLDQPPPFPAPDFAGHRSHPVDPRSRDRATAGRGHAFGIIQWSLEQRQSTFEFRATVSTRGRSSDPVLSCQRLGPLVDPALWTSFALLRVSLLRTRRTGDGTAIAGFEARGAAAVRLQSEHFQKPVVIGMAADPQPRDFISLEEPYCSVTKSDAHRIDRFPCVNLLELQAGMVRVLSKQSIRLPRRLADGFGKLVVRRPETRSAARIHRLSGSTSVVRPPARSARASAASLLSVSCEAPNAPVHRSSSASSSRSQRPTRSCSSGGSVASFAIAASSVRVTTAV